MGHPRAVARADLVLVGVDQRIERQPFFDQQRFERFYSQGKVRRNRLVTVIVAIVLSVGEVARRRRFGAVFSSLHGISCTVDILRRFGHITEFVDAYEPDHPPPRQSLRLRPHRWPRWSLG
jgi:hypothetical protein